MDEAGGLDNYLTSMSQRSTWADGVIIAAAVDLFQRSIVILQQDGVRMELSHYASTASSPDETKPPLYFGYTSMDQNQKTMNHYVSLRKVCRYDCCLYNTINYWLASFIHSTVVLIIYYSASRLR